MREACDILKQPKPWASNAVTSTKAEIPREVAAKDGYKTLPDPTCLRRDQSWNVCPARPQLEFVVDKVLAQLLKLEIQVRNATYAEQVERMWEQMLDSPVALITKLAFYLVLTGDSAQEKSDLSPE